MKKILVVVILFILNINVFSQSKVGTTAANFLLVGVSARTVALGEASVASGVDASGMYYNPAIICFIPSNQIVLNHVQWFAGIKFDYGTSVINLGNIGNVGCFFNSMNSGQIEITTEERPNGIGAKYTVSDIVFGLTYGRSLTDRFNIGATFKYIKSTIMNTSASAIASDVGLTFHTPYDPLSIGFSITNIGTEMRMDGPDLAGRWDPDPRVNGNNDAIVVYQYTKSWDLPVTLRFGTNFVVFKSLSNKVYLLADAVFPNSNYNYVNIGAEYILMDKYYLRVGMRQLFLTDAEGRINFGAGLHLKKFFFDYAYSDRGFLDYVQYFTFGINF